MDINALKANKNAKKFPAGQVIFTEGDNSGDEMYVVLEGHVSLYKGRGTSEEKQAATFGAGSFFGEATMFLHKGRAATAIASDDALLYVVKRQAAFEFFTTQPELTYLIAKTLCKRLEEAQDSLLEAEKTAAPSPAAPMPALISDTPPPGFISDIPLPGFISDTLPPGFISDTPPPGLVIPGASPAAPAGPSVLKSVSTELFPEGHKIYDLKTQPAPPELIYKKSFKCPVCEKSFNAYSVRATRLKVEKRDKDFRSHYQAVDPIYYEIVTCPECFYSNFDTAYAKPIISRFKENIGQITAHKNEIGLDLVEDRSINAVFAGYYLAKKGAPLFYKEHEMFTAKIWLRLMWLYHDVKDFEMEYMAAKKAHAAYLAAFEKTDAGPDAVQQLCVLIGELSIIVKDIPTAKTFFIKARNHRGGSKNLLSQSEDGIEIIRKIESGQMKI